MNSDRTVYAPEMDVEGNGVAPRLSVKIVWIHHDRYFARLFNPFFFFFFFSFFYPFFFFFFFSIHSSIHSSPLPITHEYIYKCLPRFKSRADISILRDVLFILEIYACL